MKASITKSGLLFIVVALLSLIFGKGPSTSDIYAQTASAAKTLKRIDDPLVVPGSKIPSMLGTTISGLSLMRYQGNKFEPIPFQVDEKTGSDEYVFTEGKINQDENPKFDANDELVFMVFDTGDRAPQGAVRPGAARSAEIEIIDPVDGGKAWAYLFEFKSNPPRSDRVYIRSTQDKANKVWRIEAKNYIIETANNAIYYNYLSVVRADGTKSPDLVDRLKIRGSVIAKAGIKLPFDADELIKTRVTAQKSGPVRLLVRGDGYLDMPVKVGLKGYSIIKYYPTFFIFPIVLDIPLDLKKVLSNIDLDGYSDFNENIFGAHYYDKYNAWNKDIVFDGRMSEAEKKMNYKDDRDWLVITGPHGTCVQRIYFPGEWDFVIKSLYYVDDLKRKDPPEDNPGSIAVGYKFFNFVDLKKGQATYYLHYYFPQDFKVGDEKRTLNIMDRPLEAVAH